MWFSALSFFFLVINTCNGIIYHLNDSAHQRMPRLFDLDRYDSCLGSDHGLYCVLRVDLFADEHNELMNQIKEYSAYTAKHYNYTYIDRGVCITQTCKEFVKGRDLEKDDERFEVIEECLNTTIFKQYGLQANVTQIYNCDKHNEKAQIDGTDWIFAAMIAALVFVVLSATLYDAMHTRLSESKDNIRNEGNYLLMNFSLRKNWNDLVNEESTDPRRNRLKVLRGVRAITNCLMILAHVFFIYTTGFIDSPHAVEKTYESFQYHLVYNGLLIVQIFFLMSAFLQSYLMHLRSEVSPIQWSELPMIMFARWWRLSPTYAVLLAFSGTWMRHLGTGPLWKMYVGDSMAAQCRRYWPQHLFYINNYIAGDTTCQVQTWHIAVDMQLFVLTMLVYMCTRGRGRSWQLALGLLLLTGLLGPPLHVWLQDLQALTMVTPEFFRRLADTRTFRLLHILCHNNLTCYVVGLATGSLVYRLQKDNVDLSKYKWGILSWCLVPGIACLFLTGRVFFAEGAELTGGVSGGVVWRALYAATLRLAMAGIVSMLVVTLTMRFCENFSKLFEWRGWLLPSRLSYSMYLLHMNLVHAALGLRTQLATISPFYLLVTYFGILMMSFLIALPFYLVVEGPLAGLLLSLLGNRQKTHPQHNNEKKLT